MIALLAVVLASAFNQAPLPGDRMESLDVSGVRRTYVLHVPKGLHGRVPLVLAFHGHLGTGADFSRLTGLDTLADRKHFIVAYPNGLDRGWDDGRSLDKGHNDLGMVDALIGDLSRHYPIDRKRIYATGFSNGGMFAQLLGCARSTTIAAIAPDAAGMPSVTGATCAPKRAVSVMEMAGTSDPLVPYKGGQVHIVTIARGAIWGAAQTVAFWAQNAHCTGDVSIALPKRARPDGTAVTLTSYRGCAPGSSVEFYSIAGGGHTWPGGSQYLPKAIVGIASTQLDASAAVVDFFFAHPMP